jgi:FKBP-type peptidyl-prolyl cis-trans isomerase (trigger factor)
LPNARERSKAKFILTQIAEKEGIEVNAQDLKTRGQLLAHQYGVSFEKKMSELEQKHAISQVQEEVLIGKVLDFLSSNANVETSSEQAVNS